MGALGIRPREVGLSRTESGHRDASLLTPDWRWELTERVAASPAFEKANRSREFLRYVVQRASEFPGAGIPEQAIGVAVFGRPAGYDTAQDNLVRVQAAQLRKRLAQYFASPEGLAEDHIIEIPRGSYTPSFVLRTAEPSSRVEPPMAATTPAGRMWTPRAQLAAGAILVLVAALAIALVLKTREHSELVRRIDVSGQSPSVSRLWNALFGANRHVTIVMADSGLALLDDILGRSLTLRQYTSSNGTAGLVAQLTSDPEWQRRIGYVRQIQPMTGISSARSASRLERLNILHGFQSDLTSARTVRVDSIIGQDTVLLGNSRTNPWIEMLDPTLNFQYKFDDATRLSYFVNKAPAPGEPATFNGKWDAVGYYIVAARPNSKGRGNALILSGTEMSTIDAAMEVLISEKWISQISARCRTGFPYFEALFRTSIMLQSAPAFELVALRCG